MDVYYTKEELERREREKERQNGPCPDGHHYHEVSRRGEESRDISSETVGNSFDGYNTVDREVSRRTWDEVTYRCSVCGDERYKTENVTRHEGRGTIY